MLPLTEIAEYEARRIEIDGTPVLVYRDVEAVYAIGAVCSHDGGPLEQGTIDGACVECPWHQSVFDMRDGHVVHGPATLGQPSYQARIRDRQIEIRLNPERAPNLAPAGSEDSPQAESEQERERGANK